MEGLLSNNVRDVLLIIGLILAILQIVLAISASGIKYHPRIYLGWVKNLSRLMPQIKGTSELGSQFGLNKAVLKPFLLASSILLVISILESFAGSTLVSIILYIAMLVQAGAYSCIIFNVLDSIFEDKSDDLAPLFVVGAISCLIFVVGIFISEASKPPENHFLLRILAHQFIGPVSISGLLITFFFFAIVAYIYQVITGREI